MQCALPSSGALNSVCCMLCVVCYMLRATCCCELCATRYTLCAPMFHGRRRCRLLSIAELLTWIGYLGSSPQCHARNARFSHTLPTLLCASLPWPHTNPPSSHPLNNPSPIYLTAPSMLTSLVHPPVLSLSCFTSTLARSPGFAYLTRFAPSPQSLRSRSRSSLTQ